MVNAPLATKSNYMYMYTQLIEYLQELTDCDMCSFLGRIASLYRMYTTKSHGTDGILPEHKQQYLHKVQIIDRNIPNLQYYENSLLSVCQNTISTKTNQAKISKFAN